LFSQINDPSEKESIGNHHHLCVSSKADKILSKRLPTFQWPDLEICDLLSIVLENAFTCNSVPFRSIRVIEEHLIRFAIEVATALVIFTT